jgi:beta-phosphoglucomutase-like phosphatase (HAD superfamily)
VFDLDGTLVDSEDLWGEAERDVVEGLGHPWDPAIRTLLLGKGPEDVARTLAAHLGGVDAPEIDRRMLVAATVRFRGGCVTLPGADALVDDLRGRVPLAIATNTRRVLAELAVESAGLRGRVDVVVCAEDAAAPKPAPDPYLEACRRLGVEPSRAVAFEDSPGGVASAKAAGLWVVGCPSFPGEKLPAADVVVHSLTAVDAEEWLFRAQSPDGVDCEL